MKLFTFLDTGPSGHGAVGRQFLDRLLDKDIELSVSTHEWGINQYGMPVLNSNTQFPDFRLKEKLMKGRINPDYLLKDQRDLRYRNLNLYNQPKLNTEAKPHELMINEFKGEPDIWFTIGGMNHAQFAPQDDDIYTIVETDWNLDIVPRHWQDYAEMVDEIWIPNQWNYDAFARRFPERLMEKVKIIPYGVDFSLKPTRELRIQRMNFDNKFTFLSIGRWCHIKGMDKLIRAFIEEFRGDEPVRLFIKTTINNLAQFNGEMATQIIRSIVNEMQIPDPPEVGVMVNPLSEQEYTDLFGVANSFVLPSIECCGISIIQACGHGLPVITLDYSAQPTYLDKDEAFFVDYTLDKPKMRDQRFFYFANEYPPDSTFPIPDQESLQEQMRRIFEGEKRDATSVRYKFDWNKHFETRMKRLEEVS